MIFLISLILTAAFVWFGADLLKKKPAVCYIAAAVLSAAAFAAGQSEIKFPEWFSTYVLGIFNKGALACALWCAVAWAAALPNGSAAIKKIMPIRGELSIFAALITLSHAVTYTLSYLDRISTFSKYNISPSTEFITTCVVCLVLMLIMIPLTVISFKTIRKKIKPKTWKNIQRAAYVFYALIYVHIMVIYLPKVKRGGADVILSILLYSAVFFGYAVFRIRKWYVKSKKPAKSGALNAVCTAAVVLLTGGAVMFMQPGKDAAPKRTGNSSKKAVLSEETTKAESDDSAETTTAAAEDEEKGGTTAAKTTKAKDGKNTTETTTADKKSDDKDKDKDKDKESENDSVEDSGNSSQEEEAPQEEQQQAAAEPEVQYIYNNGTFTGTGTSPADEGKDYEGTVYADVTIENDVITAISLSFPDDDADWCVMAEKAIPGRIMSAQSADVDASCGATRSAEGAIAAVKDALSQARK
ncbi:ferric reductase-like transmembrane domain-containing protein [Ruminococcus sp.]|uniref:FMN-binding protein n=1 Tax=Ruminococcus sp. TaxID=41978 RepID=UPI0025F598CE|nr:ferric reductase-like transmembrane domain-containing protein [Ruminococcus sp.]MBR1432244.1 ferric reductase-like transmembrane domain-containing protein [Ruminococcus sp.]